MNNLINPLVDSAVQCWGCPVFDRLFEIVSMSAAAVYNQFAMICVILFCVIFAFFIVDAVWKNIKGGMKDPWYAKSIRPVFLNSIVAMAFLGMGVTLPRLATTVTFEPIARITLTYTQTMLNTNDEIANERVTYQPRDIPDDGFFRPELRDTIILLMKTTITQFQAYMKLGIAVMDSAFSWRALLGIGALIKHIIMFFIGLYLFYGFFKIFIKFCFFFADIIIAMAFFAFFFPLSLALIPFKSADGAPSWISGMGKKIGTNQFKKLVSAIISLAAAIITYTVIMVLIAKFFAGRGISETELMNAITSGNVFAADISDDNLAMVTLSSAIVLIYIIDFLYKEIPKVTQMILSAFDVSTEQQLSEKLANDAMNLTKLVTNQVKNIGKTIINGGKSDDGAGTKK